MTVVARAPGKLILTGEYAFSAARRRWWRRSIGSRGPHPSRGRAGPLRVVSRAENERWTIDGPSARSWSGVISVRCWRRFGSPPRGRHGSPAGARTWRSNSRAFLVDGRKLGIGRSAATVTAATAAFLAAAGRRERDEVCEAAVAAHALFQEGHGSGADVAAARTAA